MHIERLVLENFRCFGPEPESIFLSPELSAFVGLNGTGKTAVMQALLRLFGITGDQRRIRRTDFHIPLAEETPPSQRTLAIEAILAFPELNADSQQKNSPIPEFFNQMAADHDGSLKCRLRLDATWIEDGTMEGSIDAKLRAVHTLQSHFSDDDCSDITSTSRRHIQMIYVPARRDGISQVSEFLRGRLWRAISWSENMTSVLKRAGEELNTAFEHEPAVDAITASLTARWQELHTAGTDTIPL